MLIFVHIPKTAGTTFKNLLRNANIQHNEIIDINSDSFNIKHNYRSGLPGSVSVNPDSSIKVITGHFSATRILSTLPANLNGVELISWVRDPIQRMISNYHYYLKGGRYYGERSQTSRKYDIIDIKTYCTHIDKNNTLNQFIDIPIDKFKFIGISEHFEKELIRFKDVTGLDLNPKQTEIVNYNINPEKKNAYEKYIIDKDLEKEIIKHNLEDWELYNKCLHNAGYN